MSLAVFVSHAVEDSEDVAEFVRVISNSLPGVRFFVSSGDSIAIGDDWRRAIETNLREAAALVVVLSTRAIDRPWIHFEAGFAHARQIRTFVAMIDGFDSTQIPATLSALQAAAIPRDLMRLVRALGLQLHVKPRAKLVATVAPSSGSTRLGTSGIYVRGTRLDHANGWVRYGGSTDITVSSRWIDPGPSFDNAFRFPPEDTLNASCDVVVARILPVERVDLYITAKLTSGRIVKLYLSTSHTSWGFTGTPSDEFRIPLKIVTYERWHLVRLNLRTFAAPLGAPITRVMGFRLRGGARLSHIMCLRTSEHLESGRDIDVSVAYPA